jgi:class 3 adenylate cyclase
MPDVREWLKALGLGQYSEAFEENDISWELLPELDHELLKEIGIGSIGHRISLLKAIQTTLNETPSSPGEEQETHGTGEAERRHLSVMFADLVGSTELSRKLDPEDLRDVNRAYQDAAKIAVERYGGFVARYMGDGVLAYFGYPQAHEDDAERAIQAGLALLESIPTLETPVRLAVRIGVATGPVVVGDLIGEGASQESAVVGETPNLAARLQSEAKENQIVIAEATQRLVDGLFELTALGVRELKGFPEGQVLWAVNRRRLTASRFQARREASLLPMVGRSTELALLQDRWETAVGGEGQIVLLVGEPGIGKSRLSEAFIDTTRDQSLITIRYQCSPLYENSAFFPFTHQLQHAARFRAEDDESTKLDKLENLLRTSSERHRALTLLATLLSLPTDRYPELSPSPEERKSSTIGALVKELEALTQEASVLILFEDVHWIDPSSLEVLGALIDAAPSLPVMLLITHRPEFKADWGANPNVTSLHLNRLPQRDGTAIVDEITHGKRLPSEIVREIIDRTDGVPLFVEELTKAVIESGGLRETESRYERGDNSEPLSIPDSLSDSLMARLDRVGEAKLIAQQAAVIGRDSPLELLGKVYDGSRSEFEQHLNKLLESQLVFRRRIGADEIIEFKHALVRDIAYDSLLRTSRRTYHVRVAEVLQRDYPWIGEEAPETIALHLTFGGDVKAALVQWELALHRAVQRSAVVEAMNHFERVRELLSELDDDTARANRELDLILSVGPTLNVASDTGWGSEQVGELFERASQLSLQLARDEDLFPAVWGQWLNSFASGEVERSNRHITTLFEIAERTQKPEFVLQAHHAAIPNIHVSGDLIRANQSAEVVLSSYDKELHADHALRYGGHDPAVCAGTLGALPLWQCGKLQQSYERARNAIALARATGHQLSLIHGLTITALLYALLGRAEESLTIVQESIPLAERQGAKVYSTMSTFIERWSNARIDNEHPMIAPVLDALELWLDARLPWAAMTIGLSADLCLLTDDISTARTLVDRGLQLAVRSNQPYWDSELHRLKGVAIVRADPAAGRAHLSTALANAQAQKSRILALRASLSIADSFPTDNDARQLVQATYASMDEHSDFEDLRRARTIIGAS